MTSEPIEIISNLILRNRMFAMITHKVFSCLNPSMLFFSIFSAWHLPIIEIFEIVINAVTTVLNGSFLNFSLLFSVHVKLSFKLSLMHSILFASRFQFYFYTPI